jgi:uncharacterized protein (DUF169 family)
MDLQKVSQALDFYIRPQTFPVAIKLVGSVNELPQKVKMPKRDMKAMMPLCQIIALARRYGWPMAMGAEDMVCPFGALTLGFVPAKPKYLDGSFNAPFWMKDQDARAKSAQSLPLLELGKYKYIIAAPLHRADFEPQLIVTYGNPAQLSRFIQAVIYSMGTPVNSKSSGGVACAQEITVPLLSDECQLVVTGGGDRAWALTQDDEAAFAMPMSKIEAIIEGLEKTHKAGMRYPTTPLLTSQPEVPQSFVDLMAYLNEDH